jgi:uncharacterized protein (DUF2141 family)
MARLPLAIALALGASGPLRSASAATVTIIVRHVQTGKGVVRACLWNDPHGFPDCGRVKPRAQAAGDAVEGVELHFYDVKPGTYAVSIMQDLNDNQVLETNFLGIPREPVGLSNNPVIFSLHRPTWNDVKFIVNQDVIISINLQGI